MDDENSTPDVAHALGFPTVEGIGYWTLSLASETMRWSPEMSRIYDLPYQEEVPMGYGATRIVGQYWNRVREAFHDCVEAGVPYDIEIEIELGDGEHRWVRLMAEPVRDEFGDIIGARGAVQDVDKYRRAVDRWRNKAIVLEHVAVARGDVVVLFSRDGNVRYATAGSLRDADFDVAELADELSQKLPASESGSLKAQFDAIATSDGPIDVSINLGGSELAQLHVVEDGVIVHIERDPGSAPD